MSNEATDASPFAGKKQETDSSEFWYHLWPNQEVQQAFVISLYQRDLIDGRRLEDDDFGAIEIAEQKGDVNSARLVMFAKESNDQRMVFQRADLLLPGNVIPKAPLVAAKQWPDAINGEIALGLSDQVITFTLPKFLLFWKKFSSENLKPNLSVFGLVVQMLRGDRGVKELKKGGLLDFLKKWAAKDSASTGKEQKPITFDETTLVVWLPQDYSSYFTVAAPVVSLQEVVIEEQKSVKIEISLPTADDPDFLIPLYAVPSAVPAGLKIGDPIDASVRLYAQPVS